MEILKINLALFSGNTNVTTDTGLSDEMKTYYSDYLIDLVGPLLVHDQFGQKHPIPKAGGKTIQFRKWNPLPKALTALTEGVTPNGQKMSMGVVEATIAQYGGFIELSDILMLTAIDNNLVQATEMLADQAGRTLDTITREVLNGGTNVQYVGGNTVRMDLVGGESSGNDYITVDEIKRAVRALKIQNTAKINGDYVAIIHPDVAYELTKDNDWKYPHQYVDTENIYSGEIGKIAGCRFVETTEAKVFHAANLTEDARNLTVASKSGKVITVDEAISSDEATALVGRKIIIDSTAYTVTASASGSAGASTITVAETLGSGVVDGAIVYPGEAGAKGRDVYSTLILGANAYGITELTGGGLQHIVKQLGSAGTGDPLDQRATAGWKATKVAERLVENYMIRVESTTSFDNIGEN